MQKEIWLRYLWKKAEHLHHDVKGKNGAGKVILRTAPAGTGIIAGGAITIGLWSP